MSENQVSTENRELPPLPEAPDFVFKTPLYERFARSDTVDEFIEWKYFKGSIDAFCPDCGKVSIFERIHPHDNNKENDRTKFPSTTPGTFRYGFRFGFHDLSYQCLRNGHLVYVRFYLDKDEVQKTGQLPSLVDLHVGDLRRFRSLLGADRLRELNRAYGLAAHGVGIGSFVYLRRIFEGLIEEAHGVVRSRGDFDEDAYQRSRMDEKILRLRDVLPSFLVENRKVYGIISKGMHELSEEECLDHFDAVSKAIEFILDERIAAIEAEKRKKETSKAITDAAHKLTPASTPTADA